MKLGKTQKYNMFNISQVQGQEQFRILRAKIENLPWQAIGFSRFSINGALTLPLLQQQGVYLLLRDEFEGQDGIARWQGVARQRIVEAAPRPA